MLSRCLAVSLSLILCTSSNLFAQDFQPAEQPVGLSEGKAAFEQRMIDDEDVVFWQYVEPFDFYEQLQPDGSVTIELPNREGVLTFIPIKFEQENTGESYRWLGKTEDGLINVALGAHEGYFGGFVVGEGRYWEFVPMQPGKTIFREVVADDEESTCMVEGGTNETPENPWATLVDDLCEEGECTAVLDLLFVYTQGVADWYGNTFGGGNNGWGALIGAFHTWAAFSSFEIALANSDIDMEVNMFGVTIDFDFANPVDMTTDLDALPGAIGQLRDDFGADLAVLITGEEVNYQNLFGIALAGTTINNDFVFTAPCNNCTYAIARIQSSAGPRWTLAHEIAHLFGARHENDNTSPADCAQGFIFNPFGNEGRTVMATLGREGRRVLHYSDPDIQFNGFNTGTPTNDNAAIIRGAMCAVTNLNSTINFDVFINGQSDWCVFTTEPVLPYTYYSAIKAPSNGQPGIGPYTYDWRVNLTGDFVNDPGSSLSSSSSLTLNYVPGCPQFYVQLTVTTADGVVEVATKLVNVRYCDFCEHQYGYTSRKSSGNADLNSTAAVVFPNPTHDEIFVEVNSAATIILLYDSFGNVVRRYEALGLPPFRLSVEGIREGIYFLALIDNGKSNTYKVIIQ